MSARALLILRIWNGVALEIGWAACVLGAVRGWPLAGPALVMVFVLVHLWMRRFQSRDLVYIAAWGALGFLVDSGFGLAGVYRHADAGIAAWLCPVWLVALWLNLATAFRGGCLEWLAGRPVAAAALGLVFGPLAYWAGARLGALEFPLPMLPTLAVMGIVWAVIVPAMGYTARGRVSSSEPAR